MCPRSNRVPPLKIESLRSAHHKQILIKSSYTLIIYNNDEGTKQIL